MAAADIEIRSASTADLEALVALLAVQLGEHGVRLTEAELTRGAEGLLENPQLGRFFLAAERQVTVGFAALSFLWTLEHGGRAAWLDELYVVPERRDRGIGRALLLAACEEARLVGAVAVDLEIERGHERVATLYEREGFRPLTRQRWSRRLTPVETASATPAPEEARTGGCVCGSVRYRVTAPPLEVGHCHCTICRRSSGAPFVTWATFPFSAFTFTEGSPAERASSPAAMRSFCGRCGTQLTFREIARASWIDVTLGSLDHPESVKPGEHIFTSSQLPWLRIDDHLPRHPGANPSERRG